MKIKHAISILIPTIYKKDLIDGLYNASKELEEVNIPVFEDIDNEFKNWDFQSKEITRLIPTFNTLVKRKQGNIITTTKFCLMNCLKMCSEVNPYIETTFEDANSTSVFSYKKVQYLQFIDAIKFYIEYTRRFVDYVIIAETGKYDLGNTIATRLTPHQLKYVENGFNNYCHLTNAFNQDVNTVMNMLANVPDITVVEENVDTVESTMGKAKVDPLRFGFISAIGNPFYAIQQRLAIRDHLKYEKALAERDLLRIKLQNMKRQREGQPDPILEKNIKRMENEIQKLEYKIAEQEKKYA